jgi:two-component system sensor histidine kinase DesK
VSTGVPGSALGDRSDPLDRGARRRGGVRTFVWLGFVLLPLIDAIDSHRSGVAKAAIIAGAAVFVVVFVGLVLIDRKPFPPRLAVPIIAFLLAIASALTIADRNTWAMLFIFSAGAASALLETPFAVGGVAVTTALGVLALAARGAGWGAIFGYGAPAAGVGMMMVAMTELRESNRQLVVARAELARLAVAEERERFARDLHDLLGHSLSVIALKAELAGRLLPDRASDAATEVAEVEQVARKALGEVRDAVSGYRRPTLDGEIAGARMALSAAGIGASVERAEAALDPVSEAVLAWAIREGATNVIRHSGARHCTLRVAVGLAEAVAEVIDDGVGANGHGPGNGLTGLCERAHELRGAVEAGNRAGGGYRLAVTIPRGSQ